MRTSIQGPRLEILPLIDVVFLLLVVFLFSMARMIRSYAIPVDLPTIGTGEEDVREQPTILVVGLDPDGALSVGGRPASLEDMEARVRILRADEPELAVLIHADQAVPHGEVVHVLDRLRAAGQGRVWIVGREKSRER